MTNQKPDDDPGGERSLLEAEMEVVILSHSYMTEQDCYLISTELLAKYDESIRSGLSSKDARKEAIKECRNQVKKLNSIRDKIVGRRRLFALLGTAIVAIPIVTFLLIAR